MNTCLYNMLHEKYEEVRSERLRSGRKLDEGVLEVTARMEAEALQDMYDMTESHIQDNAIPLCYFNHVRLYSTC